MRKNLGLLEISGINFGINKSEDMSVNTFEQTKKFIEENLITYGIKRINTNRISEDCKFLVFGIPDHGRQLGLYNRKQAVLRLEEYSENIQGVEILPKCAKSHAAESSYSNFRGHKGICVKVDNNLSLKKLLDWYFHK